MSLSLGNQGAQPRGAHLDARNQVRERLWWLGRASIRDLVQGNAHEQGGVGGCGRVAVLGFLRGQDGAEYPVARAHHMLRHRTAVADRTGNREPLGELGELEGPARYRLHHRPGDRG